MIVGLTGSFGAGKGEVARYLVEEKGFTHLSARALITEELEKRHLPVNRDTMTEVANDLRAKGGPTFLYERLIDKANQIKGDVVVESIRAVAEAEYTKAEGGVVIGVDANPELRFDRTQARGNETDQVSFEKWREQELAESNPDDPTKQDIFGALKVSDFVIENNGSLEELHQRIETILKQLEV
jgi:dephospho-CoA kinase